VERRADEERADRGRHHDRYAAANPEVSKARDHDRRAVLDDLPRARGFD
jgi:hypothetical protein